MQSLRCSFFLATKRACACSESSYRQSGYAGFTTTRFYDIAANQRLTVGVFLILCEELSALPHRAPVLNVVVLVELDARPSEVLSLLLLQWYDHAMCVYTGCWSSGKWRGILCMCVVCVRVCCVCVCVCVCACE